MKKELNSRPTEAELNILKVLWEKGASTVRQVHETLHEKGGIAYTTTLKLMQIMTEKNLVMRDTSSRTHIYQAGIEQGQTQNRLVQDLVDAAFEGSSSQLVMSILGNHKTSSEELDQIKALIKKIEDQ